MQTDAIYCWTVSCTFKGLDYGLTYQKKKRDDNSEILGTSRS
jgi:hypothetical protein